jgi:hypothetical protein
MSADSNAPCSALSHNAQRQEQILNSSYPPLFRSFFKDIREGSVNPDIVTDAALRSAVQERVPPQPDNASALESEFRRGFDGIVERIWPAVDAVQAVCTGAMLQYVPWMEKYAGR